MAIPTWLRMPGAFVLSVLLGLAASSLVLVAVHAPVLETFRAIFDGAVGSWSALESSLVFAEPIAFTGLAAAVAFRARVWNIGGEGQMVMGAFGAGLIALNTVAADAADVAGGRGLRHRLRRDLGIRFSGPEGLAWRQRSAVQPDAQLRRHPLGAVAGLWAVAGAGRRLALFGIFPRCGKAAVDRVRTRHLRHRGAAVALAVSGLLRFSRWGFEITVVGHSHEAARYAAISVTRVTIAVMLLSGALAAWPESSR